MATAVPGTCSACAWFTKDCCTCATSPFAGQRMWCIACVPCGQYRHNAASPTARPTT